MCRSKKKRAVNVSAIRFSCGGKTQKNAKKNQLTLEKRNTVKNSLDCVFTIAAYQHK